MPNVSNEKPKCRCLFCGDTSKTEGKLFVSSERKYGKDQAVWAVCNECLLICNREIFEYATKA